MGLQSVRGGANVWEILLVSQYKVRATTQATYYETTSNINWYHESTGKTNDRPRVDPTCTQPVSYKTTVVITLDNITLYHSARANKIAHLLQYLVHSYLPTLNIARYT
jgi:hypothetical protein